MPEPTTAALLPEGKRTPITRGVTGTATVTIGCKISNGIVMRVYELVKVHEATFGGGERTIDSSVQSGPDVAIRGNALDPNALRAGKMPRYAHIGGYALTHGVDKSFAEKWFEQNKDQAMVRNGLIFMHDTVDGASGIARDQESIESGMEPIDPEHPEKRTGMRGVRSTRAGTRSFETAETAG